MDKIKVITIYDNNECGTDLNADWGFGCFIDHPKAKIIFDTGAKAEILKENLKKASIKPSNINIVILSHKHWDHQGGALWLLKENPKINIYLPKTWSKRLENTLPINSNQIHSINDHYFINDHFSLIISKNLWINELALGIKTSKGMIIVTGCSHTGVLKIAKTMNAITNEKIHALLGGFHLLRSSKSKINNIVMRLKDKEIDFIAPCHCTGNKALSMLQKEFAEKFLINGVGAEYVFDK